MTTRFVPDLSRVDRDGPLRYASAHYRANGAYEVDLRYANNRRMVYADKIPTATPNAYRRLAG